MSTSTNLCVAFVSQDNDEIVVYDAKGEARTYLAPSGSGDRKLCFSTDDIPNVDDLLSPCFDEDGLHGEAEETCFCGVEDPHLHAHYWDATTCIPVPLAPATGGCGSNKPTKRKSAGRAEDALQRLAKLTLYPTTSSSGISNGSVSGKEDTESTPLLAGGGGSGGSGFGSTGSNIDENGRRRLYNLKHGGREGYLTMDEETGDLRWEMTGGGGESHKLKTSAKRKLQQGFQFVFVEDMPRLKKATSTSTVSSVINYIGDHFEPSHGVMKTDFEAPKKKTSCCSGGTCSSSKKKDSPNPSSSPPPPPPKPVAVEAPSKKKSSCCSGGTCSSSKKKQQETPPTPPPPPAAAAAETPKKKSSCCSGGTCSSKTNKKETTPPPPPAETPKKKSSCCSGGTCSSKKKKQEEQAPPPPKKKSSCCSQGGTCSSSKKKQEQSTPTPTPTEPPKKKKSSCCSGGTCSSKKKKEQPPTPTPPPKDDDEVVPSCCDKETGECKLAKIQNCCSTGKCTNVPQFMPLSLLQQDPPRPTPTPPAAGTDDDAPPVVRSTIECREICCSAEIPGVHEVMDSLDGIVKTMINVPLRQVTVDHNPTIITAKEIETALNDAYFGATIKRDGGAGFSNSASATTVGRSQLHVQHICCAAEIPQINAILEPMEGVTNIAINVTNKMVYVDHDTVIVTAQALVDALNDELFGATLKRDAGATLGNKGAGAFVRSTLQLVVVAEKEEEELDLEALDTLLASTFDSKQLESFAINANAIVLNHNPLSLPLSDIVDKLKKAGYPTTIVSDGADDVVWDFPSYEEMANEQEIDSGEEDQWPKPTVILSGIFWILSMFNYFGGPWERLKYLALLAVAFGIPGIAMKAFATMKRFMFDSNCLMFFAAVGALGFQEYSEAAAVTFLFAISDWLEARATTRGRNALSAIVNLRPDFAWIVHPKTKEQLLIPASAVPMGAVVAVKTGDKIPCDGVVVEGQSTVDESSLTGESKPVKKLPKSLVSGGTVNCGQNHLMIQTTSTAENSAISRLVSLVEEAQANRSETEKVVDEFAKVYTPIVVLAALCMCTIPWFFGVEIGRQWTYNGLVLIVVACPCALIISTPVTYVAGLAATAQRGILIKGGAHLESLGLIKTICFDKTGTLTQGSFALISINIIGEKYTRQQVLEYLVLMEERANHPLAMAIVDGAKKEGVVAPQGRKVTEHTFMAGEGLSGTIDGKQVYVGNSRLFERLGLLEDIDEELDNMIWNWEAMAGTVGFMSIDGVLVSAYCVADAVRNESLEVVDALNTMGIDVHMLTGDNRNAAKAIGTLVGLKPEGINSELLPEEKLKFITDLKGGNAGRTVLSNPLGKRELVCHVGDGVNDAPALAAADLGVAMGVGAALAMETANVTLLDSNLKKLQFSVEMGRRVLWTIKENVAFSLLVKVVVLGFTIMGKMALWAAIVSDVGAMLCVTLNGMRLLPTRKIEAELMGDVGNVSYKSQVSTYRSEETPHSSDSPGGGERVGGFNLEDLVIKV